MSPTTASKTTTNATLNPRADKIAGRISAGVVSYSAIVPVMARFVPTAPIKVAT